MSGAAGSPGAGRQGPLDGARFETPGGSFQPADDDVDRALLDYRRSGDHYLRYELARSLADGRAVLDVGCGRGVGAMLVAPVARVYRGIEVDGGAVDWSRRNLEPRLPNARFGGWPEVDGRGPSAFDLVTAFEVVEHVADVDALVREIVRRLAPGGQMLLSTPNGRLSRGDARRYGSQYHVREFTSEEVANLLRRHGLAVQMFRQFRIDRLDSVVMRGLVPRLRAAGSPGAPEVGRGEAPGWVGRLWFDRLSGPRFWRIRPAAEPAMRSWRYSTIVALGTRPP